MAGIEMVNSCLFLLSSQEEGKLRREDISHGLHGFTRIREEDKRRKEDF
jgi:hypothetical protein